MLEGPASSGSGVKAVRSVFVMFPVTFFGMVLGLGGLAADWRVVAQLYGAPGFISQCLAGAACFIWLAGLAFFILRWALDGQSALKEWHDPGLGLSAALLPMATMVAGLSLLPFLPAVGEGIFVAGLLALVFIFAVRIGPLWRGHHTAATITPILFLAPIGGSFIAAMGSGLIGHKDWGAIFFGIGMVSWAGLESVLLQRLFTSELPAHQRATLGIYYAPPANACIAYLALSEGPPDLFATMMIGYGLYLTLVMLRLSPWLLRQPFSLNYWAYSFGVASMPLAALHFVERGDKGLIAQLALPLFAVSNLVIGLMVLATLRRAFKGLLLVIPPPVAP